MIKFNILAIALIALFILAPVAQADSKQQLQQINKSIRTRHYSKAVEQLTPLVRSGDSEAQFILAGLYRSGKGVPKDLDKAIELYETAANGGHVDAQYTFASLLEKKGDETQALFWYDEAARQGHKKAKQKLSKIRNAIGSNANSDFTSEQVFSLIVHDDVAQIKALVGSGYNFNIFDASSRTPLIAALLAEHKEISDLLLPVTRNLSHADRDKNQAIHIAAGNGYIDIVKKLIDRKVDINARDNLGNTPLVIAVRHDDPKMTALLLSNDADYQINNKREVNAVDLAQTRAEPSVLKAFRDKGIKISKEQKLSTNVSIKDFEKSIRQSSSLYKGWPILSIACLLGEEDIARQLIRQGAKVNAADSSGYTALHRASAKDQVKTVDLLLGAGADINAKNEKGETALYLAAEAGSDKTVRLLLNKGADTTTLSSNKSSALSVAIANQREAAASLLADQKLDDASIHQAAYLAIQKGMEGVSVKLIKRDKLINELDKNKRSVLWFSADKGLEKATAAILLNKSVDIDQKDAKGYTPLARAILKGHSTISNLLIGVGADLKTRTSEKNTLLMQSVLSGKKEMTKLLINKKIEINLKNNSGETALMLAAAAGDNDQVEMLIEAGADIQTRNQDDLSAYEIALNAGKKDTAELIRNKSGRLFKLFN